MDYYQLPVWGGYFTDYMINLPTKLYSFGLFRTILDYELNIYQPNLYFSLHWIWIISHIMFHTFDSRNESLYNFN